MEHLGGLKISMKRRKCILCVLFEMFGFFFLFILIKCKNFLVLKKKERKKNVGNISDTFLDVLSEFPKGVVKNK